MPKLNELSLSVIEYQATKSSESFSRILGGIRQWLFTETRKLHFILNESGSYCVTEEDCEQELMLVLLKAIDRYDHRLGGNFFTVLHNHHATASVIERKRNLHQFSAPRSAVNLAGQDGSDLATLKATEKVTESNRGSYEEPDQMELSDEYDKVIDCMKSCLKTREFNIIRLRAKGFTLEEIGEQYGLTKERIRQIESSAKLKFASSFSHHWLEYKPPAQSCFAVEDAIDDLPKKEGDAFDSECSIGLFDLPELSLLVYGADLESLMRNQG